MNSRLVSASLCLGCIFCLALNAFSQTRHWSRTLRGECQAIAFNPRSTGRILFAACHDSIGLFRADDGGSSWLQLKEGLEPFFTSNIRQIIVIPSDTAVVLAVSPTKLYRSSNGGRSWNTVDGLGGIQGEDIVYHDATDAIYFGQNFAGPIWKSIDHGQTWTQTGPASRAVGLCTLSVSPDSPPILIAGSEYGAIVRSTNEGAAWAQVVSSDTGRTLQPEVPKIVYSNFAVKNGLHSIAIATRWLSTGRSILKTIDNGETWSALPYPSPTAWALDLDQRSNALMQEAGDPSFPGPARFWIGLFDDRSDTARNGLIQETTDGGITWHSTNFPTGIAGSQDSPVTKSVWVIKFDTTSGRLAAATSTGLYISDTKSEVRPQWSATSTGNGMVSGRQLSIMTNSILTEATIYSVLGTTQFKVQPHQRTEQIDCSSLPAGAYFIRLEFEDDSRTVKKLLLP